jgi:multidrug efflux pump subunit AcrA (membrane-fusion protein)
MATLNNGTPVTLRTPASRAGDSTEPRPPGQPRRPGEHPRRHGHFWLWAIIILIVLGCIFAFIMVRKHHQSAQLKQVTQEMAVPTVLVVHPEAGSGEVHLVLPGAVQAYLESSVYAQISGYIKGWKTDIGTPVKQGELMAEIEAPVVEQNLQQVQANLGQAEASLALAKTTAARYNGLLAIHAVSQQDVDNQNGNVQVQQANVAAAQAGVSSIQHQLAFRQVVAPFDGVVTARRVDVGDLVTAGGGTSAAGGTSVAGTTPASGGSTELFRVSQTNVLRVYVSVPEHDSAEIVPGGEAIVTLASNPNRPAAGTLVRTAKAIDPASLTLLAEVDVQNPTGNLLPGGYAQVRFDMKEDNPPLLIPGNALIFRAQGTQVGVVGPDNKVEIRDIKLGRDFGTKLEILDGLKKDDEVIVNPSDSLTNGLQVKIKQQSVEKETQPPKPQS